MGDPAEAGSGWAYASGVQVGFVGVDGVGQLGSLVRYWDEPFERAAPVRKFISFKGQKNFTGDYWAATSRDLVGYESWVERDAAMALDFDPAVVALASQPFCLSWWDGGRDRQHTPDYFARLADGTGAFRLTSRTCGFTPHGRGEGGRPRPGPEHTVLQGLRRATASGSPSGATPNVFPSLPPEVLSPTAVNPLSRDHIS